MKRTVQIPAYIKHGGFTFLESSLKLVKAPSGPVIIALQYVQAPQTQRSNPVLTEKMGRKCATFLNRETKLTVQVLLLWPHYFMSGCLADSFRNRRAGDAVLSGRDPVSNALSGHSVSAPTNSSCC